MRPLSTRDYLGLVHLKSAQCRSGTTSFSVRFSSSIHHFLLALAAFSLAGCAGMTEKTPPAVPQIAVVPSAVDFQNVVVGQKNTQSIQISNVGKANLDITAVSLVGAGLSLGAVATPMQLAPGQSKSVTISFTPTSTASVRGSLTITSDASTPSLVVPVQGTTSTPPQHSVFLSWTASTSTIVGYHVYRATVGGGPYSLLSSVPGTSYTDANVVSGGHYFYVTTAVDSVGAESSFSNETSADIPNP